MADFNLANGKLLSKNEDFKYLIDRLHNEDVKTSLPDHYLSLLKKELESLSNTSNKSIEIIQDFMRRNHLKGDRVCFGDEQLFYTLIPEKDLLNRLSILTGEGRALSILDRLRKDSKTREAPRNIQKLFKNYKLDHSFDSNLSLKHMSVKPYLTWIFTTPSHFQIEDIVSLVKSKELQNRLGLEGWSKNQPYVILKLLLPNNIVLHKPTILDAGIKNRYFEIGGFTRPINENTAGFSEWVTDHAPSFEMIDYMEFVEVDICE